MPPAAKNHNFSVCGWKGVPPAAKNRDFYDLALNCVPPAAKKQFSSVFNIFFKQKHVFQWKSHIKTLFSPLFRDYTLQIQIQQLNIHEQWQTPTKKIPEATTNGKLGEKGFTAIYNDEPARWGMEPHGQTPNNRSQSTTPAAKIDRAKKELGWADASITTTKQQNVQ